MPIVERAPGMQDIFGEHQRYFAFIKKVTRHEFRKNGFTRITTPMLEYVDLFASGFGEKSDIFTKELYTLEDKKGRKLAIKADSTIGVMRAYMEHFLEEPQPIYAYYIEPHLRHERLDKSLYRQFHQIGAEIIGEMDPVLDAKMIYIEKSILDNLGLKDGYTIKINSLGNKKEMEKYLQELVGFFDNKKQHLSEQDLECLEKNPFQILASSNPDTKQLLAFAPKITDFLKKESAEYYKKTKEFLDILEVSYVEDPFLVPSVDYHSQIIWQICTNDESQTVL